MSNSNTSASSNYPLYIRLANIAILILAIFYVLYIGRRICVPLAFSTLFAILLNPAVNWLCSKGLNRVASIGLALGVSILVTSGMVWFIFSQLTTFAETFPALQEKFGTLQQTALTWVSDTFGVSLKQLNTWVQRGREQGLSNVGGVLGQTLTIVGGLFAFIFLLPVYIFFILYYKPLLLDFVAQLFAKEKHPMVFEVLTESKFLIQSYLAGLLIEMAIVAALDSTALLLIGVEYAILLGILAALLNVIPYIGGLVAISLPMLVELANGSITNVGLIFVAYSLIQFFDNNFIVPRIVASKVKLNALVSIVVVLVGAAIWGIPGMFLSLPVAAITKVIFDRVEPLKPWGFLLGDTMPPVGKEFFKIRKSRKKEG